ncbi:adhesion G-protein coupled receptor F3 [Tachysurus vachellii]|uniref:adhesion G-protein coupled receptor F3 n=1 Tax=Tachysurus vachellii TaxID=175792 RepID=UPI00296AA4CF|nr:adhesion G-protein coupled receptor F3 [Tachysurus vachellii]
MKIMRGKTITCTSMLLCGLLLIYSQMTCVGADDIYVAELMIEGNATMDVSGFVAEMIMPITATVSIVDAEIIAECELVGDETTCWCAANYIWSDLVIDTVPTCCNVLQCVANISDLTPMCVPQVNVTLSGIILMPVGYNLQPALQTAFSAMNGFNSLTVTSVSTGQNFVVSLNATFRSSIVQAIIASMRTSNLYIIDMNITSTGLVTMEIPIGKVCSYSQYRLNCSTDETMQTCTWLLSSGGQYPQTVGIGTEVIHLPCSNQTAIDLLSINGNWAGTYTCLLTNGSVSHSATGILEVALLPDKINVTSMPQTADCSVGTSTTVTVSCSIFQSPENYTVTINGVPAQMSVNGPVINYTIALPIDCTTVQITSVPAICQITNSLSQIIVSNTTIPIIYPGDPFCLEDNGWPKTKGGETATILCTATGRVGNMERMCNGTVWANPIDLCTKESLNILCAISEDFEKGIGATTEGAIAIFESLKNSTSTGNSYGDVMATVSVITTMSGASTRVAMTDSLLPNFIDSASVVLNTSWNSGNTNRDYNIATTYLSSVEKLVQNIQINCSDGHNSSNIQLQICRNNSVCNKTVFNVEVELNSSSSIVKTMGMQGMAERLPKGSYSDAIFPSIVVTAVVENNDPINISMAYPIPENDSAGNSPVCIFWNTTQKLWSTDGCVLVQSSENMSYCECNHLTSFSMLMSKTPVNLPFLDQITYIGLGISICSLIVFLIIEYLVWNAVVKSNLSHFRHMSLVNISLCLLIADCAFVASSFPNILNNTLCLILTLAKHFFYLGMFFWMLCLSMMLLHQLIFVFNPLRKSVYMPLAIIVGYFFPTVVVGVTYVYYNKRTDVTYYSRTTCWLTYVSSMKGSLYSFLLPIGFIVFANCCSMVVVISTLLKPAATENTKKDDKEAAKSVIKVIVFLTPVFGGTWILGLFVFLMDDNKVIKVIINYAFTIVNSLQGLFILLTGCFGEKRVRDEIVKLVNSSLGFKSESKSSKK